jgi:tetratricopeptide (TPR) repeat protein
MGGRRDDSGTCDHGDGDDAIAACSRLIERHSNDAPGYLDRGFQYDRKGEYDRAIADFDRAISLNPKDATYNAVAYNNRGLAWDHKGEFDRAVSDYDRAIALDPKDAVAYNNWGLAWSRKGDYERAIADYDTALRLAPGDGTARANREAALRAQRERNKAGSP